MKVQFRFPASWNMWICFIWMGSFTWLFLSAGADCSGGFLALRSQWVGKLVEIFQQAGRSRHIPASLRLCNKHLSEYRDQQILLITNESQEEQNSKHDKSYSYSCRLETQRQWRPLEVFLQAGNKINPKLVHTGGTELTQHTWRRK